MLENYSKTNGDNRISNSLTSISGDSPVPLSMAIATNSTNMGTQAQYNLRSDDSSNSVSSIASSTHSSSSHINNTHHYPQSSNASSNSIGSNNGNGSSKSPQNIVFIHKLYNILENSDLKDLIWWSSNGLSFYIKPNETFSKALATYFKHTNITSFVRQLNIYGFHKVTNLNDTSSSSHDISSSSPNKEFSVKIWEFKHSAGIFKKGDPDSLKYIKRRSSSRNVSAFHNRKNLSLINSSASTSQSNTSSNISNNLISDFEVMDPRYKGLNSSDHVSIPRSQSTFSPFSSSDNIINLQRQYNNIQQGVPANHQSTSATKNITQAALNISNEFMIEQFNSLNNDMMQMLNVLQNFVTLQNSVLVNEESNPTATKNLLKDNFQNQYNLLYQNISNLKNDLVNKYQTTTTNFYEQQHHILVPQPVSHSQINHQQQYIPTVQAQANGQISMSIPQVQQTQQQQQQPQQQDIYYQTQFVNDQTHPPHNSINGSNIQLVANNSAQLAANSSTQQLYQPVPPQMMNYQPGMGITLSTTPVPMSYAPNHLTQQQQQQQRQQQMRAQEEFYAAQNHTLADPLSANGGTATDFQTRNHQKQPIALKYESSLNNSANGTPKVNVLSPQPIVSMTPVLARHSGTTNAGNLSDIQESRTNGHMRDSSNYCTPVKEVGTEYGTKARGSKVYSLLNNAESKTETTVKVKQENENIASHDHVSKKVKI